MELVFTIALFAFSAGITPGPNNIMLMTSGVNFGIKRSMPHLLGIIIGFPSMVVAIGLGLSAVFQAYPMTHQVIKVAGIIYLLYLSWRIANSSSNLEGKQTAKPFNFFQAAAFQWVNPKGWIMAVGAIATFTDISHALIPQVLTIAVVFFMVALPCASIWLSFGIGLKKLLKNERQQRIFNISMALLLVLSIIQMALPD
ncbi:MULTISPECIES: LysE family translocator [Shewanella]|uniref:Lysine transporter LysE n=1 Tax=Shewanella japonica TaxID=93973 RepID=A0ABN4YG20_9GAMM|nr:MULTISPECIES: LysE family translocator [Shewanella]ARD21819.1 lysine transporter LysE [Shewanella japonica]KPZ72805.1 Cysteine/O-acetylserine efflux protein [Shewanella sp. P1-14-1]MBQ4888385.1 LysE family translocator [Shewanella sp. MMG014]OBT09248.1 lysine transporter LysE [Shewanella sp. UCD-FRSSP16_17]